MGYPNFGKVKTLVLPLPRNETSIDEYKNLYGIDLRDFVELSEEGIISLKNGLPNTSIFIDDITLLESGIRLNATNGTMSQQYEEGVTDAIFGLIFTGDGQNTGSIWEIIIPKDADFNIDNIKVRNFEV